MSFNASVYVSEQLNRQLMNMNQDFAQRCVAACAEHYNFDAEEAYRYLNLSMIKVERKAIINAKASKVSTPKPAFPLPYNGEFNDACCYALRQNNGLYTQCTSLRKGESQFCKGCATFMQKTGTELPEYGTIQQRMATDIFDYTDPKGRKPTSYTKVMKKYKINEEQVMEEANKLNIIINREHFVVKEETKRGRPKTQKETKVKGAKGRPKKEKKVLTVEGDDEDDLFASLVADAQEEQEGEEEEQLTTNKVTKKNGKTEEEKEAERIAKEEEKEQKRLAAEVAKKANKAEKEAKKEEERLAREAKKKADEEEKEKKRLAAEVAKKEKEAAKKAEKSSKKTAVTDDQEEEADVVKKVEFEGKKYLKSKKTGIVYDYNEYVKNSEQIVVGKWNDSTNKIDFSPSEEEEEEEDYEV